MQGADKDRKQSEANDKGSVRQYKIKENKSTSRPRQTHRADWWEVTRSQRSRFNQVDSKVVLGKETSKQRPRKQKCSSNTETLAAKRVCS